MKPSLGVTEEKDAPWWLRGFWIVTHLRYSINVIRKYIHRERLDFCNSRVDIYHARGSQTHLNTCTCNRFKEGKLTSRKEVEYTQA